MVKFLQKRNRKNNHLHLAGMGIVVSDKTPGQRWDRRHAFLPRISVVCAAFWPFAKFVLLDKLLTLSPLLPHTGLFIV